MLSQQITLLTRETVNAIGSSERTQSETLLREALGEFHTNHLVLSHEHGLPGTQTQHSDALRDIYEGENSLNAYIAWFEGEIEQLLAASLVDTATASRLDALSRFARTTLLTRLNDVVDQHESESHARVRTILLADIAIFALTMTLLICEALFIFRPMARDVAERTQLLQTTRDQLDHQANHDELTGLPNRRFLRSVANEQFRAGKPQAVMQIDLDGFKQVNDVLGHAAGDALLREVASRMQRSLRESDCVARAGGDEFVVVLSQMEHEDDHALVAERLIQRVSEPITVAGRAVEVGASIGIALAGNRDLPFYELLGEADVALYEAKHGGKGTWRVYRPEGVHESTSSPQLAEPPTDSGHRQRSAALASSA